jgi:tetratricopeptide (TPR) repeat protein
MGGRTDDGRDRIEAAVTAAPNSAFAYVALGVMHDGAGRLDDAELCWQRALNIDPADVDAAALLTQARVRAGDMAGAERIARAALVAQPKEAFAFFSLAKVLLDSADIDEALQLCTRGIELEPEDWRGWLVYARVLTRAHRADEARASLERALLVQPGEPEVMHELALACLGQSDWPEAERLARKVTVLNPRKAQAYLVLARARAGQERFDVAGEGLLHALRVIPDDADLLLALAEIRRRAGHIDEAIIAPPAR